MADDLDPDVARFFETGQLTGALAQQVEDPALAGGTPANAAESMQQPQPAPDLQQQQALQQQALQQRQQQQQQQQQPQQPAVDQTMLYMRNQLSALQQHSARLEQTLKQMQEQAQQTPGVKPPDPETDPLGHTMYELAEVKKMITALNQNIQLQDQAAKQMDSLQNFVSAAQEQGQAFAEKTPDFDQAYQYIRNVRIQDMRDMGLNDAEIKESLFREELQVSSHAMQNGINPAEFIYRIAQRYGYRPTAVPPQQQQQQNPADRMAALQRGMQAAPPAIPPAGAPVDLTIDAVKDMAGDQLDRLVENDELWQKTIGGRPGGDSIFH